MTDEQIKKRIAQIAADVYPGRMVDGLRKNLRKRLWKLIQDVRRT